MDANLRTRIITALGLGFIFVAAVILSEYSSALIFLIIALGGLIEFYTLIAKSSDVKPQKIVGAILGLIVFMTGITLTVLADSTGIARI